MSVNRGVGEVSAELDVGASLGLVVGTSPELVVGVSPGLVVGASLVFAVDVPPASVVEAAPGPEGGTPRPGAADGDDIGAEDVLAVLSPCGLMTSSNTPGACNPKTPDFPLFSQAVYSFSLSRRNLAAPVLNAFLRVSSSGREFVCPGDPKILSGQPSRMMLYLRVMWSSKFE